MQVTADVDCTPEEVRAFLGLPDVRPLQAAVLARMEKRMLAEADRYSPERLMKTWLSLFGQTPPQGPLRTKRDVRRVTEPPP